MQPTVQIRKVPCDRYRSPSIAGIGVPFRIHTPNSQSQDILLRTRLSISLNYTGVIWCNLDETNYLTRIERLYIESWNTCADEFL